MLRKFIKFSIGNNNLNEYQTLKYLQLLRNITIDFLESSYFQPEKIECVIKLIEKVIYRDKKPRNSKNLKLWAFYVMHNYSYMQSLDFQKLISIFVLMNKFIFIKHFLNGTFTRFHMKN